MKGSILGFALVLAAALFASANADCMQQLATLDFPSYAECYSYPVETHTVQTDDGYILTIFRIQAKNTQIVAGKPVVLFWHGLFDSSDSWIINDEAVAPGFILANQGHDIWFSNSRGNRYSLGHTTLDHSTDKAYWAFSWQQMSEHDVPAVFNYIAGFTGQKINYIGHSQGTTQMFAALGNPAGRNPLITNNLRKFAALGPVTYMAHTKSKLFTALAIIPGLPTVVETIFPFGIFDFGWESSEAGHELCKYLPWACAAGISLVADVKTDVDNVPRLQVAGGHFPAGTSTQDILHWRQEVDDSGNFEKYDYGASLNEQIYGQSTPPQYDATLIQEDVAFFVGNLDELADTQDATTFCSKMVNAKTQIRYYNMGHITFLLGKTLPYIDDLIHFLDIPNTEARLKNEKLEFLA